MTELPKNYKEVLREASYRKDFSIIRWELMSEKIEAVLNGENPGGNFEGWDPEHAKKLKQDLSG